MMRVKEVKCLVHDFIVSEEAALEFKLSSLDISKLLIGPTLETFTLTKEPENRTLVKPQW